MKFQITVDIFKIFLLQMEIYNQSRFQKLSLWTNSTFLQIVIYFRNKLLNQMKNSNNVKKTNDWIEWFQKINGKKKNLRGHIL